MLALFLATAIGQVDVGDYLGYGETIRVQAEPYAYSEDEDFAYPQDVEEYDQFEFTDGGDGGLVRGARVGTGGVASVGINQVGPGAMNLDLTLVPNRAAGDIISVVGQITVSFYDVDDREILEYILPIFAIFAPPRAAWTWQSGPFRGIPPGVAMTATFSGCGLTTGGFWTCPGVAGSNLMR